MTDLNDFNKNGFVLKKQLFSKDEIQKLINYINSSSEKKDNARETNSSSGKLNLTLWNHPSDDLFGKFSTNERIVRPMEQYLGDEVYHYHSKIIWKKPGEGGFDWHQDYGYWYHNHCLYPDMGSVVIAVDPATTANGCLQVIKGSHRCGRIEHGRFGNQTGADPKRVDLLLQNLEHVYCEMEQGDALFFHANLLHSSDPNQSDKPRWLMICCYNSRHNPCNDLPGHPSYRYMEKWPDDRIVEVGCKQWTEMRSVAED